jgi:ferritin-like metal-binding protein YciE
MGQLTGFSANGMRKAEYAIRDRDIEIADYDTAIRMAKEIGLIELAELLKREKPH